MGKIKKVIFILILLCISIGIGTISSVYANNNIKIKSVKESKAYIGSTKLLIKKDTNDNYVYSLENKKKNKKDTIYKKGKEKYSEVSEILKNGFPNKKITGDDEKDYYITQTAIWYYLDKNYGKNNLGNIFTTYGKDKYKLRNTIIKLSNKALDKKNKDKKLSVKINSSDMVLTSDSYISNEIKVLGDNIKTYNVKIKNMPKDTKIISSTGQEKDKFNIDESFQIKVPKDNIHVSKLNVEIISSDTVDKVYEYTPSVANYEKIISYETVKDNKNIKLDLNVVGNNTNTNINNNINKDDNNSNHDNKNDSIDKDDNKDIDSNTSDTNKKDNVDNNSDKTTDSNIDNSNTDSDNKKDVIVPDTDTTSLYLIIIGSIIIGIGLGKVYYEQKAK